MCCGIAIFGQLREISPTFTLGGGLLANVERPRDDQYILELKPGLRFADGQECTVEHLEYGLLRHSLGKTFIGSFLGPVRGLGQAAEFSPGNTVSGIYPTSDRRLIVEFDGDPGFFEELLAFPQFSPTRPDYFETDHVTWRGLPDGLGAYEAVSVEDARVELELRPDSAVFDTAAPRSVALYTQEGELRRRGESPHLCLSPTFIAKQDQLSPIVMDTADAIYVLTFNYQHELAMDLGFRQAVASSIDSRALAATDGGYGPAETLVAPHLWSPLAELAPLQKTPVPSDIESLEIPAPTGWYRRQLQDQLRRAGVDATFTSQARGVTLTDADPLLHVRRLVGMPALHRLAAYQLLTPTGVHASEAPPRSIATRYYELFERALIARDGIAASAALTEFHSNAFAVPLITSRASPLVDRTQVSDLGAQPNGVFFYLDRLQR
jgi:hypothetical protein